MLRSNLCDYNDTYIVVTGSITVVNENDDNYNKTLVFKNNAPFTACISNINGALIDNAEDLDVAMPMYNLLEYSKNYDKTAASLQNYHRDEPKDVMERRK